MKKTTSITIVLLALAVVVFAAKDFRFEESERIQRTLSFEGTSGPREIQLDNIFGSVKLTGTSGKNVQLVASKTIKARTKARIEKAKQEVSLDIAVEDNLIDIYVDGPFRSQDRKGYTNHRDPGYQVQYDFEIKVPKETNFYLKTVTDGDITVENMSGDFEVKNVNGKVTIIDVAGSGLAHTVNGGVKVYFSRNPENTCSFKTVNGDLELYFKDRLSADFRLKTFHGDAYTDFEYKPLPTTTEEKVEKKGKYVYKYNHNFGVRVGKGGPEIKMDTLNGDLLIKKH
ncbi:DUF4097 domain-containing protein [Acidobacteriota bacterium]